jgi:hypothetical protein
VLCFRNKMCFRLLEAWVDFASAWHVVNQVLEEEATFAGGLLFAFTMIFVVPHSGHSSQLPLDANEEETLRTRPLAIRPQFRIYFLKDAR